MFVASDHFITNEALQANNFLDGHRGGSPPAYSLLRIEWSDSDPSFFSKSVFVMSDHKSAYLSLGAETAINPVYLNPIAVTLITERRVA